MNTDIDLQTTILKIKGNVIPTPGKLRSSIGILSASNNLIDFKNIYKEQQDEQTIEIANTRDKEIEILLIDIPEYLSLKVDKQIIAPGERSNIHVLLMADKIKEYGKFQYSPEIELKFADNLYSGSITIRANIREDFSHLSPQELVDAPKIIFPVKSKNIGIISEQSDQFVTFEFHNSGKSELLIHNIQLNNSTFTLIEYSKYIKPEAKGIIRLKLTDNHKNSLNSSFTVISNDPQNSEVIIQIFGSVKKQETGKTDIKNHLENIDLQKAWELIEEYKDSEKLVVLDVRTPDEFKAGFIPGALNFDFEDPDFKRYLTIMDINKLYLVYCAFGKRSKEAISLMNTLGFENVFHMADGFEGWQQKRLPIEIRK